MIDGLEAGERIVLSRSGWNCAVGRCLGETTLGRSYEVVLPGRPPTILALMWYRADLTTAAEREALAALVALGPPIARFSWPVDIGVSEGRPGFGYVTTLPDPGLASMLDLRRRGVEPSWRVLARVGVELAGAFAGLHAHGLCYQSFDFADVLVSPTDGAIEVRGWEHLTVVGAGTPPAHGMVAWMAPELSRRERAPDVATDRHTLAVFLFWLLVRHNPFVGAAEKRFELVDEEAARYLWAEHPVFIFDPEDDANAPVPGEHANALTQWPRLPGFLRRLFTRAFTAGLADPDNGRVSENDWREALAWLRDLVVACPVCRAERVLDPEHPDDDGTCPSCGAVNRPPLRLEIHGPGTNDVILVEPGVVLSEHHLNGRRFSYEQSLAMVVAHPTKPRRLGLANRTEVPWQRKSAGTIRTVNPGQTVALSEGVTIDFGHVTANVVARWERGEA